MNATQQNILTAKLKEYRACLKDISNGLQKQAIAQKRENYTINTLLCEYYNLVGKKLQTFDQWNEQNYNIRKGEHAYHFWDKPKLLQDGSTYHPIQFLFSQDQVQIKAAQATA